MQVVASMSWWARAREMVIFDPELRAPLNEQAMKSLRALATQRQTLLTMLLYVIGES